MTLFGSKKGYSKSDINFFEEFSASARKQTQVLAVVVFVGIIAIGLCLAVLGYCIFRNIGVQKDIDDLNAKLASDEYAGLELRAQALQQEIADKNRYYFTLTEMKRFVDETNVASTEIIDLIGENIPSDAYVTTYNLTGTTLEIQGLTFSYYDAANICYLLNCSDVFASNVVPAIEQDTSMRGVADEENPIDVYYDFTISGNLVSDSVISIGHYAYQDNTVVALSGVSTETVPVGGTYEFSGITSYTAGGNTYTLASVSINGTPVSESDMATITANDSVSGVVTGNVQISLYYNVASATTETVAESEGCV